MNYRSTILLSLAALACAPVLAQDEEQPILTFKTNAYELSGGANHFSIFLGSTTDTYIEVDAGYGLTEVEIQPAYFDYELREMVASAVPITVSEAGVVKIYGNPKKINYVDISECAITEVEWPELTEVEIVAVDHNNLNSLDLSNKLKLQSIDVSYNQFLPSTPIVIGEKPELEILYMPLCDYVDPNFDMTLYPKLQVLSAGYNGYIEKIDPTKCPNLVQLTLTCTDVAHVDVSKNPELYYLDVSNTKVTSVDVSHNPKLKILEVGNTGSVNSEYKFSSIDLSHNPELWYFGGDDNLFTELDFSAQTQLTQLTCSHNLLKSLDTGLNPLGILYCSYNYMNFNTLPQPPEWCDFLYAKQAPIGVDLGEYGAGSQIDFRDAVYNDYSTTTCTLYYVHGTAPNGGPLPVDESKYSFKDGILTLHEGIGAWVYASFHNDMYYLFDQLSQQFEIGESGVDVIQAPGYHGDPEYYTLDGTRLDRPEPGTVCIVRANGKTYKAVVK